MPQAAARHAVPERTAKFLSSAHAAGPVSYTHLDVYKRQIPDMVRAAAGYITEKNVAMFERTGVLTQAECHSRYEICLLYTSRCV